MIPYKNRSLTAMIAVLLLTTAVTASCTSDMTGSGLMAGAASSVTPANTAAQSPSPQEPQQTEREDAGEEDITQGNGAAPVTDSTRAAAAVSPAKPAAVAADPAVKSPAPSASPKAAKATSKPASTPRGEDPVQGEKEAFLGNAELRRVMAANSQLTDEEGKPAWEQKADRMIAAGFGFLGAPYVFGAKYGQTESFDCSSFLKTIFAGQGIKLPRESRDQSLEGTAVAKDELRRGDLVFFTTPKRRELQGVERIGHVALYIGDGMLLHTFRPGVGVTVSRLAGAWENRFVTARRVLQ